MAVSATTEKHIVRFRNGSGYAVFELDSSDVISPTFDTEDAAQKWLDDSLEQSEAV